MADRVLGAHEVSKRVESDLWRLLRSLDAALQLNDPDITRAVSVRCSTGLPSLLTRLEQIRA